MLFRRKERRRLKGRSVPATRAPAAGRGNGARRRAPFPLPVIPMTALIGRLTKVAAASAPRGIGISITVSSL